MDGQPLRLPGASKACSLEEYLGQTLPAATGFPPERFSRSKLRRLILAGAVRPPGGQTSLRLPAFRRPDRPMRPGESVVVWWAPERFFHDKVAFDQTDLSPADLTILFQDDDLLVLNKPSGLPCEAGAVADRVSVLSLAQGLVSGRAEALRLAHRLDRDTSGVLVLAKTKTAAAALQAAFETRQTQKLYWALCGPRPPGLPERFTVEGPLARLSGSGSAARWGFAPGGQTSRSDFILRAGTGQGTFLEVCPLTGRTHQIRVHAASRGLSLWGDTLYGGPATLAGYTRARTALHARSLSLPHPRTRQPLTFSAPPPDDFLQAAQALGLVIPVAPT